MSKGKKSANLLFRCRGSRFGSFLSALHCYQDPITKCLAVFSAHCIVTDAGAPIRLQFYDPDQLALGNSVINLGPSYAVQAGESLSQLAAQFRTTVRKLLDINPDIQEEGSLREVSQPKFEVKGLGKRGEPVRGETSNRLWALEIKWGKDLLWAWARRMVVFRI